MKNFVGIAAASIGVLILVNALAWVFTGNDLLLYRFFAPRYEDARREVFENTRSFNQGLVQELQNMQFEYVQADDEHKRALASIILHRAAGYEDRLPSELRQFVSSLKTKKD